MNDLPVSHVTVVCRSCPCEATFMVGTEGVCDHCDLGQRCPTRRRLPVGLVALAVGLMVLLLALGVVVVR
jgi:hypothetical protein